MPGSLRLMTMNIWHTHGDWPARRDYLRDGIDRLAPDVLTMQETGRTDDHDQVRELLGADYRIVHSTARSADGMGISTATRCPVRRVTEVDLQVNERTADFPCTALLTEIESPLGEVLVINHFPSWKLDLEAERESQALRLIRAVDELVGSDQPVIIAGDLDAAPDAASVSFLTGRRSIAGTSVCYRDAWDSCHPGDAGHTYTPENPVMVEDWPFRRIDYILVRCGEHGGPMLTIADCVRLFDSPSPEGVWASDHFGLTAELVPNDVRAPEYA